MPAAAAVELEAAVITPSAPHACNIGGGLGQNSKCPTPLLVSHASAALLAQVGARCGRTTEQCTSRIACCAQVNPCGRDMTDEKPSAARHAFLPLDTCTTPACSAASLRQPPAPPPHQPCPTAHLAARLAGRENKNPIVQISPLGHPDQSEICLPELLLPRLLLLPMILLLCS